MSSYRATPANPSWWWRRAVGGLVTVVCGAVPLAVAQSQGQAAPSVLEKSLQVGVQQLLEVPEGVRRLAVGDDTVLGVQVQRAQPTGGAAQLVLTPLKPGVSSLMVWPQGTAAARHYVLTVRQRSGQEGQRSSSLEAHAQRMAGDKAAQGDAGVVLLKSHVVQVDVKVVEINKNRMQQAGINLFSTRSNSQGFRFGVLSAGATGSTAFGSPGLLAPDASSPFAQAFGLLLDFGKAGVGVNLGMLEGSGMARVLAEPSLVTLSGQSANFLAGGEIPIPLSQGNGSVSIEYKPYGVGLTVSPTVLDDQRIVLKVAPESSELDYANAVTLQSVAVPAITTRRADTTVELGDGESFVIGGLVSQATVSSVNRVPLLSQIPVLGTLFKRQEFSRKERELVIIVTPRLVRPFAQGQLKEGQLPGAGSDGPGGRRFWGSYVGPSGSSDALPGFSE